MVKMPELGGRVAIVTGGNSHLGSAIASAFVAAGAAVVVAARDEERGVAVASELGQRALFVRTDLAEDASIAGCVAAALERFERIDFLVNNAVVYADHGVDSSREEWLAGLNVNLVGGDPYGGALSLDQNFLWRPFARSPGHRTPVERLWQIGASTWPGPGLGGGSGTLVAQELLKPSALRRILRR